MGRDERETEGGEGRGVRKRWGETGLEGRKLGWRLGSRGGRREEVQEVLSRERDGQRYTWSQLGDSETGDKSTAWKCMREREKRVSLPGLRLELVATCP